MAFLQVSNMTKIFSWMFSWQRSFLECSPSEMILMRSDIGKFHLYHTLQMITNGAICVAPVIKRGNNYIIAILSCCWPFTPHSLFDCCMRHIGHISKTTLIYPSTYVAAPLYVAAMLYAGHTAPEAYSSALYYQRPVHYPITKNCFQPGCQVSPRCLTYSVDA